MSETLNRNPAPHPEAVWLLEEWGQAFAQAIEAMGAERPRFEKSGNGEPPQGEAALWWSQEFSLSPGQSVWIGAEEAAWKEIGGAALKAVGVEPSSPGDVRDTYREILVQSLSSLGRSMTARCRQEVECLQGQFLAAPPDGAVAGLASFQFAQGPAIFLCAMASRAFLETLGEKSTSAETTAEQVATGTKAENAVAALRSLAGLEMPISISFGRARVSLQDALMLKRGSLVALDQRADEPVEFRVNDRIIARGEVVVVDDSYAVKIVELVSRGERLNCAQSLQRAEISSASQPGDAK